MTNLYEVFARDVNAATEGRWIEIAGTKWRIRSMDSPEVIRVIQQQAKRQSRLLTANGGTLPPEIMDANDVERTAACVTGWEGVTDRAGKPLAFTPENVRALLGDPEMIQLRREIADGATEHEFFRKAAIKAIEGNSSNASSGTSVPASTPEP